jgi:hypothetical protein
LPPTPDDPLIESIRACLEPRSEIAEAYLFGSHARGRPEPHSDIDVAVYLVPSNPSHGPYGYEVELVTELIRSLGRNRVDLVVLNRADPVLYHRVLRDGVRVLSRDLASTTVREGRALSRYCDWVPQLAKLAAVQSARIARGDFGR